VCPTINNIIYKFSKLYIKTFIMEVKGAAVLAIKEFVKTNYESEYNVWFDSLESKSKSIYEGPIDATKWYPVKDAAVNPTEMLGKCFFKGDINKGAWESGRYSAQKALTGIYKIFVKASSPAYIIQRASRVFATYYRPCKMQLVSSEPKKCIVEISQMDKSLVVEQRILGWIEKALEISGCKNIQLEIRENQHDASLRSIFMIWD
jgi:hypothetical protein